MVIYDKQPFDIFMSQLKETNATLDFFCDFNKISKWNKDNSYYCSWSGKGYPHPESYILPNHPRA